MDMFWMVVNMLAFVGTPVGLTWAWYAYAREKPDWSRLRDIVGLIGLMAPTASVAILFFSVTTKTSFHPAVLLGAVGLVFSFAGRPRLIFPQVVGSVGSVMLWYGLTLP